MTYALELRSIMRDENEENHAEQFSADDEYLFQLLIMAIKLNMSDTVAHLLTKFNKKQLSVVTSFNNPDISSDDMLRKTLIIVAVEYNAHECLEIVMQYALEHHADDCRSLINFFMPDHDHEYTALDMLLYESAFAVASSPLDKLKKSINLLMANGAENHGARLIENPCFCLNFDLVKFMVEEHQADINNSDDVAFNTNIGCMIGESPEDYQDFSVEQKNNLKNIMKYLLERGADINGGGEGEILRGLIATGSVELFELVKPYKQNIDFSGIVEAVFPRYINYPYSQRSHIAHKGIFLANRLLDMPVPQAYHAQYMKILILSGTSIDINFALTEMSLSRDLPNLTEQEHQHVFNYAIDSDMDVQKALICKVREFNLTVPTQAYGSYLKVVLSVGSDDDLSHTFETLDILPSSQWLAENNPFKLCQRIPQAHLLKRKIEEQNLTHVLLEQSSYKSFNRFNAFFANPSNIAPTIHGRFIESTHKAIDVLRESFSINGLLSLKDICILIQVSKAFYGPVNATEQHESVSNHSQESLQITL